ncbi:LuxR family transcriptional regulator [Aeromicrobium sp. A1-2]|uniref:helix-turn-helix domain-containing protein n=1 Tax=Aeromicrobium sp. A1-2 TaxID=2107713 RepID=UPI000E5120D4|nr:helix-turn-helix transcriptional regulator [Aeromicrobium sp. A1-2]AXT86570.1 LuxR family transcriptional regulator [Aeromicrobium sp. A1-2]
MSASDQPLREIPATDSPDQLDPALDAGVLTVIAVVDLIDVTLLSAVLEAPSSEVHASLDQLRASGTVLPTAPHLSVGDRQSVLDRAGRSAIDALHERVLPRLMDGPGLTLTTAEALIGSECRDPRLATLFRGAIRDAHESERQRVLELGVLAGADPIELDAQLAECAAAGGNFEQALRSCEKVLARPEHPAVTIAVRAAAVAHAHRGMTHMSADLFRYLGPERVTGDAAVAVWALLGDGDREAASRIGPPARSSAPTASRHAVALLAQGLRLSLVDDGSAALPVLVQSAAAAGPVGELLVLPDSPAALAALAAMGLGELDTADAVLTAALDCDLGGALERSRHQLLLAWVTMLRGDLPGATTMVDHVVATSPLGLRDTVMTHALRVGIARRGDDPGSLTVHWNQARTCLAEFSVDLYSLLSLGELALSAARVGESYRLTSHLADADALLERLGRPPLWAAMFHWYSVHAAILAEEPAAVIPHADALVTAAPASRVAGILARAGQTWIRVLRGDVDVAAVRFAVSELEVLDLHWDATRLAAHAAARASDRQSMLELMQIARATDRMSRIDQNQVNHADTAISNARLTDREWEVAALVLEGLAYREIGERLFISPKTVEHHVARIRRRLGAESRQDMLAVLRRLLSADDDTVPTSPDPSPFR